MVHKRTKKTRKVTRRKPELGNLTRMAASMGTAVFAGQMGIAMAGAFKK